MMLVARSLAMLRKQGAIADVCERWLPRINRRRDLFTFADVVSIDPKARTVALIQVTAANCVSARLAKIRSCPAAVPILAAGVLVLVHGWKRIGGRWRCRVVSLDRADLAACELVALPRGRQLQKGEQQQELFPESLLDVTSVSP
jgi:hypothetical protein